MGLLCYETSLIETRDRNVDYLFYVGDGDSLVTVIKTYYVVYGIYSANDGKITNTKLNDAPTIRCSKSFYKENSLIR